MYVILIIKYKYLLLNILVLANEEEEESRVVAAKLFNALANNIGTELCEIYVVPTVASFAEDSSSKVRKALASNFLNMCRSISKESFSKKMIPVYEKLSQDSLWTVRRSACSSIHYIAEICSVNNVNRLLSIYKQFTKDNQKFVKNCALEVIGYFTDVLPKDKEIKSSVRFILDFYIKTLENLHQSNEVATQTDNELIYNCAFNFPAILLFFGKESWVELKSLYIKMTSDRYYKVRKSLASSINEVANIIGKKETEQYLIPIFDRFYREEGEIQRAIYRSMPKFLFNINEEKRNIYLNKLKTMLNGREKWRVKRECVDILGNLGGVFSDDIAFDKIFSTCVKLCVDEVSEVRMHAAKSIKSLIVQFLNNDSYKEKVLEIIKAFALSLKYQYRNLFIYLAEELVSSEKDIIEQHFMEYIELLSRDKIINIQIHIAKLVAKMTESNLYKDNKTFRKVFLKIKSLTHKLVIEETAKFPQDLFGFENKEEENEIVNSECSNASFTNRMSILVDLNIVTFLPGMNGVNKFDVKSTTAPSKEIKSINIDDEVDKIEKLLIDNDIKSESKEKLENNKQDEEKMEVEVDNQEKKEEIETTNAKDEEEINKSTNSGEELINKDEDEDKEKKEVDTNSTEKGGENNEAVN